MKALVRGLFFSTFFWSSFSFAQSSKLTQEQIAFNFTKSFFNEQYDSCWAMLDKKTGPQMDFVRFRKLLGEARSELPVKNNIELLMHGHRFFNDNKMSFYTFKYTGEANNSAWYLFDVLFISDDSNLVVGFRPNKMTKIENGTLSFQGDKTVISAREEIKIGKNNYTVLSVNIVGLEGNYDLISIQIQQAVPGSLQQSELKAWAYNEGIKFAKWLFKSEHYKNAMNSAKEQDMTLISELGVSFINPNTKVEHNVMIKALDYK